MQHWCGWLCLWLGATGCAVPAAYAQSSPDYGHLKDSSPEQRAQENAANAQAVAQVKELSMTQQSAFTLAEQGNDMCFAPSGVRYAAAQAAYREALKLEPKNTYVLACQATCYARQGMEEKFSGANGAPTTDSKRLKEADKWFNRALGSARQALKVNENYGTAHLVIAELYAMMGRPEKALETLETIEKLKLIPEGREAGFYAWRAYTKHLLKQTFAEDSGLAAEYSDPIEFTEYVDRLQNPDAYKDVPPANIPVAPYP